MLQLAVAILFGLAACASSDETPIWVPSKPAKISGSEPSREAKRPLTPSPVTTKSRLDRVELEPREPSVKSKEPLSQPQRRALQNQRQALNSEIRTLERWNHFDVDREADRRHPRAYDARRLRNLKARQGEIVRRLRGD